MSTLLTVVLIVVVVGLVYYLFAGKKAGKPEETKTPTPPQTPQM